MRVEIWTDGASRNNQHEHLRIGGWGSLLVCQELKMAKCLHGKSHGATNNEMELYAVYMALKEMKNPNFEIDIYTDSQYVVNIMNDWRHTWKSKNWKVNKANLDLVKKLSDEFDKFPFISINHVKGHAGILGNEICDRLGNLAIDDIQWARHEPIMKHIREVQLGNPVDFHAHIGTLK